MKTSVHFVVSLILAVSLYPVFGWKALFVFAGGVLIDVDHYLWHIYKYRDLNILNCYKFHIRNIGKKDFRRAEGILLIFHTIEFLLLAVALSFYMEIALISTIGLLLHYLLDLIWLYFVPGRFIANHSVVHWIINSKISKIKDVENQRFSGCPRRSLGNFRNFRKNEFFRKV